ncbi:MAG: TVP38/TMEM64 family protein [Candidatus Micrarchaeota archaeon]
MRKKRFEKADIAILVGVAVLFLLLYLFAHYVDPGELKSLVLGWGVFGPLAIIGMQIAFSVLAPLPNSIPIIVAGSIYGTFEGALYATIGSLAGAAICYALAVKFGRGFVHKVISRRHMETVELFFARHGFESVVASRFIPVMSFDAVSYGAGLVRMEFWMFMAATVVGMVPGILFYAFIGDALAFQWLVLTMAIIVIASAAALPFGMQVWEKIAQKTKLGQAAKGRGRASQERKTRRAGKNRLGN